jgi:multicomponent Na+:H+ antiporter subunit E
MPVDMWTGTRNALTRVGRRAPWLALLWWAISGADVESWLVGIPVVLVSAAVAVVPGPPPDWRVSMRGLMRFLPFFIWRSCVGGVDVAVRALDPRLPISPSLERHALRLSPGGPARVFFVNIVSLLPGTLVAQLHDDHVTVHVLRGGSSAVDGLRDLEWRVAALFGQDLPVTASRVDDRDE